MWSLLPGIRVGRQNQWGFPAAPRICGLDDPAKLVFVPPPPSPGPPTTLPAASDRMPEPRGQARKKQQRTQVNDATARLVNGLRISPVGAQPR